MSSSTMDMLAVNQNTTLSQDIFALTPPIPPTNQTYTPGDFHYIKSSSTREMFSTAYQAITQLELWPYMKEDPGPNGFAFCGDDRVKKIYAKIEDLGYYGHSGSSFGCVLRDMQFIARSGEKELREKYLLGLKRKGIVIL